MPTKLLCYEVFCYFSKSLSIFCKNLVYVIIKKSLLNLPKSLFINVFNVSFMSNLIVLDNKIIIKQTLTVLKQRWHIVYA